VRGAARRTALGFGSEALDLTPGQEGFPFISIAHEIFAHAVFIQQPEECVPSAWNQGDDTPFALQDLDLIAFETKFLWQANRLREALGTIATRSSFARTG